MALAGNVLGKYVRRLFTAAGDPILISLQNPQP
jgi:hypothetical protein